MKILYVAKHGNGDNDDEGAIAFSLSSLGHKVISVHERDAESVKVHDYDFALFHKFEDLNLLESWPKNKPRCFWYFDLVEHDDFELRRRSKLRREWAHHALEVFHLGFMTDGDWVAKLPDQLVHLLQGADERVVGIGHPLPGRHPDILFTGTTIHGSKRMSFCAEMRTRYDTRFRVIGDRNTRRIHGRQLADLMSSVPIIVAPDSPVTEKYWSNRVYQALGFGGFLLHPRCKLLETHYKDGVHLIYYDSRDHLYELIGKYLNRDMVAVRSSFKSRALDHTIKNHLYRHRCQMLVETMIKRFAL